MDTSLVFMGLLFVLFGMCMLIVYLVFERGSILDPIAISWAGYIAYIAIAVLGVGVLLPIRDTQEYAGKAVAILVLGSLSYAVGLYLGRGERLARCIPRTRPQLSTPQVWTMATLAVVGAVIGLVGGAVVPAGFVNVFRGVTGGCVGAAVLLGLFALLNFRGRWLTKAVMLAVLVGMLALLLKLTWSRRPVAAVAIALAGYYYRTRLSQRGLWFRVVGVGAVGLVVMGTLAYLTATRTQRVHGGSQRKALLSLENATLLLGGSTISYRVLEFTAGNVPQYQGFLYGSGYVPGLMFWIPRAIWPSKPVGSGYVITQRWLGTEKPSYTVSFTFIGEAYVNFGWVGVILVMLVTGKIVRVLNTYMRQESHNAVVWLAWLLASPDFATEWRGDFTSITVQGFLRVAVFLGFAWVADKLFPHPRSHRVSGPRSSARAVTAKRLHSPVGALQSRPRG